MNVPRARPGRRLEWIALGLIAALFLGLATRRLDLPGLAHGEAYDPAFGMELALGLPRSATDWSLTAAGRTWPLRVPHPYDFNAFDIYWSALAFKTAGVGVPALRLSSVLLSAATLIFFCALCRLWLGPAAAFAAGLLLAVNPAFLIWSRFAYWAVELQLALPAVAALLFFSVWQRSRRAWALYAGAFVWGFSTSMTTKSVAFLLAYPLLYLALVPRREYPPLRQAAAAAACAALGAADFLAYNLARGGGVLRYLLDALSAPTIGGVHNLAVARNIATRWSQFLFTLDASNPSITAGPGALDRVFPAAFAVSFAALAWRCAARKPFRGRGFVVLLLWLLPLLLLETAFTPNMLDPQHVLVLWPFTVAVVAAGLDWAREEIELRHPGKGAPAAAALLVLLAGSSLRADAGYLSRLVAGGGAGAWSSDITALANYLDQRKFDELYSLSPGLPTPIAIITGGRVNARYAVSGEREITPRLLGLYKMIAAAAPDVRFVSVPPAAADPLAVDFLDGFRALLAESGKKLVVDREFPGTAGRTAYVVWRVE